MPVRERRRGGAAAGGAMVPRRAARRPACTRQHVRCQGPWRCNSEGCFAAQPAVIQFSSRLAAGPARLLSEHVHEDAGGSRGGHNGQERPMRSARGPAREEPYRGRIRHGSNARLNARRPGPHAKQLWRQRRPTPGGVKPIETREVHRSCWRTASAGQSGQGPRARRRAGRRAHSGNGPQRTGPCSGARQRRDSSALRAAEAQFPGARMRRGAQDPTPSCILPLYRPI